MEFHQRSCRSVKGQVHPWPASLRLNSDPPTVPRRVRKRRESWPVRSLSPPPCAGGDNNSALCFAEEQRVRIARREKEERSICAPIRRGVSRAICWEMQHSANATARPPSLQSCALLTDPEWISERRHRAIQLLSPDRNAAACRFCAHAATLKIGRTAQAWQGVGCGSNGSPSRDDRRRPRL